MVGMESEKSCEGVRWCDLNSNSKVKEGSWNEIKPTTVGFDQLCLVKPDSEKCGCNVLLEEKFPERAVEVEEIIDY